MISYCILRAPKLGLDPKTTAHTIAAVIVMNGVMFTTLHSLGYGFEKKGEGRRVSLFYGPELDRALVLALVVPTGRLAKAIPKGNKSEKPLTTVNTGC